MIAKMSRNAFIGKLVTVGLVLIGPTAPATAEQLQPPTDNSECHFEKFVSVNDSQSLLADAKDQLAMGDYELALKYIRPMAEQGNCEAQTVLGLMYKAGYGVVKDYAEAARWLRRAATRDAEARTELGLLYITGSGVPQDFAEAAKWFRLAAENGEPVAQYNLGVMYETGTGVPQNYVESVKWYRLASTFLVNAGLFSAQYNLGVIFETGRPGVPQDNTEALKWYRLAAQGPFETKDCSPEPVQFPYAQYNLGTMYDTGRGVLPNPELAARCYMSAAERGVTDAQITVGAIFEAAQRNPKYRVLAHVYYSIAARHSTVGSKIEQAERGRDRVARGMTSREIAEAQKLANTWVQKPPEVSSGVSLIQEWKPNSSKETINIYLNRKFAPPGEIYGLGGFIVRRGDPCCGAGEGVP